MRILHTSDWHLGKRLMERERLPEQAEALAEIAEICQEKEVDLVLVAGDVFDTYLPPAEAEELFFRAVKEIAGKSRAVVVISGNHDDGVRLAASAPLAGEEGIYIFGGRSHHFSVGGSRDVRAIEAGDNYVVIENAAGERVYVNALPYPNEARLKEEKTEEDYAERTLRWIKAGDASYDGNMPHILLSHIFVAGSAVSDSERDISLGGARSVPADNLPQFGYTALGHLHKPQKVGNFGRYSGSLLQYSFDEVNTVKEVILLETQGREVVVTEECPLKAGKRLVRLEANNLDSAISLMKQNEGKYIELTLHLSEPLTANDTQMLREANEGLVSLMVHIAQGDSVPVERRATMNAEELFTAFYRRENDNKEPDEALKTEFLRLLEEDM